MPLRFGIVGHGRAATASDPALGQRPDRFQIVESARTRCEVVLITRCHWLTD